MKKTMWIMAGLVVLVLGVGALGAHTKPPAPSPTPTVIQKTAAEIPLATPSPTAVVKVVPAPATAVVPISTPATATPKPTPTAAPTLSNNNYYTNVDGNSVHDPAYSNSVPAGATAQCRDGTYSFSQHRSGTCSHHGGVAAWL